MNLYRFITFRAKRTTWRMNRHVWKRNAIDTYIEKTTDCYTEEKNNNPHILLWFYSYRLHEAAVKRKPLTENRLLKDCVAGEPITKLPPILFTETCIRVIDSANLRDTADPIFFGDTRVIFCNPYLIGVLMENVVPTPRCLRNRFQIVSAPPFNARILYKGI